MALEARAQTKPADSPLPHLEKRGQATQLMVDGKPFLVLAGELSNTVSSDTERMKVVWPVLANQVHMNTVLTGVSWDWIEPEEGKYDFRLVDQLIESAKQNNVRIVWLWFASWKNGLSSFAPAWVKAAQERFPRAQIRGGKTIEVLSTLSHNNLQADARAFAALMRRTREVDKTHRVIMVQLENEVGVLGDARDRSPEANQAFAEAVPPELMEYLVKNKQNLLPEFKEVWETAGVQNIRDLGKVFGTSSKADEIFMGWNYARYINGVAEAGKKEYSIPMFVNAWIVQPEDKGPGDYPSGGPQAHMHDVWRAGAPAVDLLCPDIYLPDFTGITGAIQPIRQRPFRARIGRRLARRRQCLLRHRPTESHRLFALRHRQYRTPAEVRPRWPAAFRVTAAARCRNAALLRGLQDTRAACPLDPRAPVQGDHRGCLAQPPESRPADQTRRLYSECRAPA